MIRILAAALITAAVIGATSAPPARADDDPYGVDTTVCTLWQSGAPPSRIAQNLHGGPLHLPLVTAQQQTWTAIFGNCQQ